MDRLVIVIYAYSVLRSRVSLEARPLCALRPEANMSLDAALQDEMSVYVLHFIAGRETIETVYRNTTATPE